MLPSVNIEIKELVNEVDLPSRTYYLDRNKKRFVGFVDGIDAMAQAIDKILNTERNLYPIYSSRYGSEWQETLGKSTVFAIAELERYIKEALLADKRIEAITDFKVALEAKRVVALSFTAITIFGNIDKAYGVN